MSFAKRAVLGCVRVGMNVVYSIYKLLNHPENRVVFISRQSNRPSEDFRLLADEIKRRSPETSVVFSCRVGMKNDMGADYIPLMLRQMWLLAGARACVTENYCPPISMLHHRDSLTVVQMWHSMVAIKKFGWQTVGMPEGSSVEIADSMRMHAGYDYVVVGSEYQRQFFAQAMRQPIESVLPYGVPHADAILRKDRASARESLLRLHPEIGNRKIVAYLPTMRRGEAIDCQQLISDFDYEHCALVVRLHPLDSSTVISDKRCVLDNETSSTKLVCGADIVISDYSGAAAEASLLDKPLYFFTPDEERYSQRCGLNIVPSQVFPEITHSRADSLIAAIGGEYDMSQCARVRDILAGSCMGDSTGRIAELVLGKLPDGSL